MVRTYKIVIYDITSQVKARVRIAANRNIDDVAAAIRKMFPPVQPAISDSNLNPPAK